MSAATEGAARGRLSIWTIYENQPDYPQSFVAMECVIKRNGQVERTGNVLVCPTLEALREILLVQMRLICRDRSPDMPVDVVESWI